MLASISILYAMMNRLMIQTSGQHTAHTATVIIWCFLNNPSYLSDSITATEVINPIMMYYTLNKMIPRMNLKIPGKKTIIATIATMIQMMLLKLLCFITTKFCHKGK